MFEKQCLVLAATLLAATACGHTNNAVRSADRGTDTPAASEASGASDRNSDPLPKRYASSGDPRAAIAAALRKSRLDNRPVLLDFGADWCPDCAVLAHKFRIGTVRKELAAFHVVAVDVGRFNRNLGLVKKYGLDLEASGIPALVSLSPDGKVRATTNDGSFERSSSMSPKQLAAYLRRLR